MKRLIMHFRLFSIIWIICGITQRPVYGQNISSTPPVLLWESSGTDRPISAADFGAGRVIAWKAPGPSGKVLTGITTRNGHDSLGPFAVPGSETSSAPAVAVANERIWVYWTGKDQRIRYASRKLSDTNSWSAVKAMPVYAKGLLTGTVSVSNISNTKLLITAASRRSELAVCIVTPVADSLTASAWNTSPFNGVNSAPAVAACSSPEMCFFWRSRSGQLYRAGFNWVTGAWLPATPFSTYKTQYAPAATARAQTKDRVIVWAGDKKDKTLYYQTEGTAPAADKATPLPSYIATSQPVTITSAEEGYQLFFLDDNGKINSSMLYAYHPARWMEQLLGDRFDQLTLGDIAIPGSHDAGMSYLSATAGQQKGVINECNTLTQNLTVTGQLDAGIRMFDLRAGKFAGKLFTKHASSDCMEEAMGGGYGESLRDIAYAAKAFLEKNRREIVLFTFSHFCEKELSSESLKDSLALWLGTGFMYEPAQNKAIGDILLRDIAGKIIISFEDSITKDLRFPANFIGDKSSAFINFRRRYAATHDLSVLLADQKSFFTSLAEKEKNDLIRMDWQLTQTALEASMVCNSFESEEINPAVNTAIMLVNTLKKNKTIRQRASEGNRVLASTLMDWMATGVITTKNRPNILYVDMAGAWVTDIVVHLNRHRQVQ